MDVRSAFVVAVMVAGSAALSAQGQFNPDHRPAKDPYRELFDGSVRTQPPSAIQKVPAPRPQAPIVVCGMRIIPADPRVDPKMRVAPPAGVEHTMRMVTPQMCRPE